MSFRTRMYFKYAGALDALDRAGITRDGLRHTALTILCTIIGFILGRYFL